MSDVTLYHGDCLDVLPTLASGSVDAVICDPPYPCIKRSYGEWTEAEWHAMMRGVVAECRRVLTPSGSAVFILQPNSERVGRMRPWLFDFQAWCCREWNMVQDAWWWNFTAITEGHAIQGRLLRPSVKACVWLGDPDCYRDQDAVLWAESERNAAMRSTRRLARRKEQPSGHSIDRVRAGCAAVDRGGVLPFNLLPIPNSNGVNDGGAYGHGASTPGLLCDWWVKFITPLGGVVLDPFMGSGTTGLAAIRRGRSFVGIEKEADYVAIARRRLAGPPMPLFDAPTLDDTADLTPLFARLTL